MIKQICFAVLAIGLSSCTDVTPPPTEEKKPPADTQVQVGLAEYVSIHEHKNGKKYRVIACQDNSTKLSISDSEHKIYLVGVGDTFIVEYSYGFKPAIATVSNISKCIGTFDIAYQK